MNNFKKYNLSQAARIMNINNMGRSKIYKALRKMDIVDSTNKPAQKYIDLGFLDFGMPTVVIPGIVFKVPVTLVVGEKGLNFVEDVLQNYLKVNPEPVIYRRSSKIIEFKGDEIIIRDAFGE